MQQHLEQGQAQNSKIKGITFAGKLIQMIKNQELFSKLVEEWLIDNYGLNINLSKDVDILELLFSENHGIIIHAKEEIEKLFSNNNIKFEKIGTWCHC